MKTGWVGHNLRRNCMQKKKVIEGKEEGRGEVVGRRGRRLKQLLDDVKKKRGYCKLKDEALHRTLWRTHLGTGSSGTAVRQKIFIPLKMCSIWHGQFK